MFLGKKGKEKKKKKQAVLKNNCTAADLLYTKNYHSSQNAL